MDLKSAQGVDIVRRLLTDAHVLVEGFRPCVTERIGLGPDDCLAINPALVYGRMTGWGQAGPLARAVGHDINYIALTGALDAIGAEGGPPVVPLNLVGDFGGGALYLAFGIMCALFETQKSGQGQVVDAAIVDGAHHLMGSAYASLAAGMWHSERGHNMLQGGAPWYGVYETRDGRYICVGALEHRFYRCLMEQTGLAGEFGHLQHDRSAWPRMRERLAAVFRSRTRDEWTRALEGTEACFAPVLSVNEVATHPHMSARRTVLQVAGKAQPAPAPRFSRTPAADIRPPVAPGTHTDEILAGLGLADGQIAGLRAERVVA